MADFGGGAPLTMAAFGGGAPLNFGCVGCADSLLVVTTRADIGGGAPFAFFTSGLGAGIWSGGVVRAAVDAFNGGAGAKRSANAASNTSFPSAGLASSGRFRVSGSAAG